jgi:DtxR family Mn-dependent transcriptional regulator
MKSSDRQAPGGLSSTVENYLKCLYQEQQKRPDQLVGMGQLAQAMQVTPGSATAMVKTLEQSGLVHYEPRGGTALTPTGEEEALNVLRRHRLLELFLVQVLGLDWSEVHAEAERLEHAISAKVLDRMDALLQHPAFDPHGDPIPTRAGHIVARQLHSLAQCAAGDRVRLARVTDEAPAFLQLLGSHGLHPGTELTVVACCAVADAISLRLGDGPLVTLGTQAAAKILVESRPA